VLSPATRLQLRRSLVAIPAAYLVGAAVLGVLAPQLDSRRAAGDSGIDPARDILTTTATGMIAFTGFVVAGLLVVVQFAAGQYSPRLVLWFRRDLLIKHAIGCFLASFLYALVALRWLERDDVGYSPDLTVAVALVLLVVSAVLFLVMLQRVTDGLRPRSLYAAVARAGIEAARETYPLPLGEAGDERAWRRPEPAVVPAARAGVLASVDRERLIAEAARVRATIELVPAFGEFIGPGEALLRIHGGGPADPRALYAAVLIAEERTIEQDPGFALRIAVDTAIRALSPAVNDPTTAVHGLDAIELLVRELAARDLETALARDGDGAVRLVWSAPSWPDVLDLAFDEIRQYGATSVQVCRRLRAVLDDLRATTAPVRHAAIDEHLRRLDAAVLAAFPEAERDIALVADPTGLGLARR
jgi:uncharacterized membrane protein